MEDNLDLGIKLFKELSSFFEDKEKAKQNIIEAYRIVNKYRELGLSKDDVIYAVEKYFYNGYDPEQYSNYGRCRYDTEDEEYEIKLEEFVTEIMEYTGKPYFWDIDFDTFIKLKYDFDENQHDK